MCPRRCWTRRAGRRREEADGKAYSRSVGAVGDGRILCRRLSPEVPEYAHRGTRRPMDSLGRQLYLAPPIPRSSLAAKDPISRSDRAPSVSARSGLSAATGLKSRCCQDPALSTQSAPIRAKYPRCVCVQGVALNTPLAEPESPPYIGEHRRGLERVVGHRRCDAGGPSPTTRDPLAGERRVGGFRSRCPTTDPCHPSSPSTRVTRRRRAGRT